MIAQPASRLGSRVVAIVLVLVGALGVANAAHAQPANDAFANATPIAAIPYSDTLAGIGTATAAADDPPITCRGDNSTESIARGGNTVWYRYVATADDYLLVRTDGSTYDTMLAIHTGDAPSNLLIVPGGCSDDAVGTSSLVAGVRVTAGTTYYIEVARFTAAISTATLTLTVQPAPRYQVTKTADTADGTCGGDCSLREAIGASNASPGAILVPAGTYPITIAGANEDVNATGDLDVRASTAIHGAGARGGTDGTTIDVLVADRALHYAANSGTLLLSNLRITHGDSPTTAGAVNVGGTLAWVDLDRVHLVANEATTSGGAMNVSGGFRAVASAFVDNEAGTAGGALQVSSARYDEIERSAFVGNFAAGDVATSGGGAIATSGGGIRIVDTTITANRASGLGGGLLANANGYYLLRNVSIIGNFADVDGDGPAASGGGLRIEGAGTVSTSIFNSVLAGNRSDSPSLPDDCSRDINAASTAIAYTLIEAPVVTCSLNGAGGGNINNGTTPNLGALDSSGETPFLPPLSPSATIDTGDPAGCVDTRGRPLLVDQRGLARQVGTRCDMGAVEFGGGGGGPDALFANGFE